MQDAEPSASETRPPGRSRVAPRPGIGEAAPFRLVGTLLLASLVVFGMTALAFLDAADELARGALATPAVLLAAHLLALGFLPLAVAGAALHVLPIFLRVRPRPSLGWAAFGGLAAGPALAVGIARHEPGLAWPALVLVAAGLAALLSEVAHLVRRAPRGKLLVVSRLGVALAGLNGILSFLLGVVLFRVQWQPWAGIPHERLIAIHLHLAVVGCLTLLIVTVGRTLVPMLAMAPAAPRRHHPVDELLLAAGTWLVVGGLAAGRLALVLAGLAPTLAALGRFAGLALRAARTRRSPTLEPPLGHVLVGLVFLGQAVVLTGFLASGRREPEVLAAYATLVLLGWAAGVTLGHLGKLLALSAWTWWPPGARPKQAVFFDRRAWSLALVAFAGGVQLLALGPLVASATVARLGGVLLVVTALLALGGALRTTWPPVPATRADHRGS
jgi:hypothetical protein